MRHVVFTSSILISVLLSACAQDPQSEAQSSELAEHPTAQITAQKIAPQKSVSTHTQATLDLEERVKNIKAHLKENTLPPIPARYKSLGPQDISPAEIHEFIALQKKQRDSGKAYNKLIREWAKQDAASRGPQPKKHEVALTQEDSARHHVLNVKVQKGNLRKKYQAYVPKTLTQEEANELITLEQAQLGARLEKQALTKAWSQQDPATRGPYPKSSTAQTIAQPRRQELQAKIGTLRQVQHLKNRLNRVKAQSHISISDTELQEHARLQAEKQRQTNALQQARYQAQRQAKTNGGNAAEILANDAHFSYISQQMTEIDQRIDAIEAPLKAAEKAKTIRRQMAQQSHASGIPLLAQDLDEVVALNAEKDRLEKQKKSNPNALYNDEDYARLKDVKARLKDITAPMTDAINVRQDAQNPALRQHRLRQQEKEKWNAVWQDKKQAGEIPPNAHINSPSYAELQDRVEDYSTKLKSRANEVGYSVPKNDIKRLDTLNEDMLAIRKSVYDMEAAGPIVSAQSDGRLSDFKLKAGMFKVQLIENKQRNILAALSAAEAYEAQAARPQNQGQFTVFNGNNNGFISNNGQFRNNSTYPAKKTAMETFIENYRRRGIKISRAEADDLLAFERELEKR